VKSVVTSAIGDVRFFFRFDLSSSARAYERHFSEWRHVNGMKALGIPNTKHFKWVTKIQDAIQRMFLRLS
jgi:hypothetical protein